MDYWNLAQEATKGGAHVAAVVYYAMGAERHRGGGYNDRDSRNEFVRALLGYAGNLKKDADKEAVMHYLAMRQGGALWSMGYHVNLEVRITQTDLKISAPKEQGAKH